MRCFVPFILLLAIVTDICAQYANAGGSQTSADPVIESVLRGNGMYFVQNKGQIVDIQQTPHPEILFKGSGASGDVYLRKTGLSYVLSNATEVIHEVNMQLEEKEMAGQITEREEKELKHDLVQKSILKIHRIDVDFVNCNLNSSVHTSERVEGYVNYYYAHCSQGITNVSSYNEVTIKNIYNNIDVKYYGGKEQGLKYDIVINPGGDTREIQLKYSGAEDLVIKNEKLIIKNSVTDIIEDLPKVYQNINGKIVDVKTKYRLERLSNKDVIVHFQFSIFNSSFPLIVDPWVSYYGGNNEDEGYSVAIDPTGNAVVTGYTFSGSLPGIAGSFQNVLSGACDVFVIKMDAAGNLLWATYYGGTSSDYGYGIFADAAGNILLTGNTLSTDFPLGSTSGNVVYQNILAGAFYDTFLIKLDSFGGRLWATYFGGSDKEWGYDVTTDGSNDIYLYGKSWSSAAISTAGTFQPALNGASDVFVAKFAPTGSRLWGTYVGGSSDEFPSGSGIVYDPVGGDIYITGYTYSNNFPVFGGHQMAYGGGVDAFIFRLNSAAGMRIWSTYYGGSSWEYDTAITTDKSGNVIFGGWTSSTTAIVTPGAQQTVYGAGIGDAYIVKFNSNGVRQWGTYLGGNASEAIFGFCVDGNNNIYVLGDFEDRGQGNYPISSCAYQTNYGGGIEDQFIAKYTPGGQQRCITYLGGPTEDDVDFSGMAIFDNYLYISGYTQGGYPVTSGAYQTTYGGGTFDAFIAHLCINLCEAKTLGLNYIADASSVCTNAPVKFTPSVTNSCDTTGYKFHWVFTGGTPATSDSISPTVKFSGAGNYDVKLVVTTLCKKDSITKSNFITVNPCWGCTLTAQYTKGTANCTICGCKEWIMVTGINGSPPYSYQWPDGYDKRYKNALCPGTYTINVKDKNGCSVNLNVSAP